MYSFLTKHGTGVAFGFGVLIALIALLIINAGLSEYETLGDDKGQTTIFNFALSSALVLIVLAALLILAFGGFHLVMNPKGAIKFLIGFAALVVLFFVFASIAQEETSGKIYTFILEERISAAHSKIVSGGIITMGVLALGAILSMIVFETLNLFK